MAVEVRWMSDPACPWSWGAEPQLRHLFWEFGTDLSFSWVMGGMARSYGSGYRDSEAGIGSGADCFADLIAHWLAVAAASGMPLDPRLWTESRLSSTYPACLAAIAACEQGPEAGYRYLRRIREALMCERKRLDHAEALIAEAGPAGIDAARFEIDLRSNAIVEAFGAQLEEVRAIPAAAREQGKLSETEGIERVSFPASVFAGPGGERHGVYGHRPYAAYREAALAAGAEQAESRPAEPLEAIDRFGRCATAEIVELSGRPRPVVEAELWRLATEWRLKPVPVLTGTLWEMA